MLFLHTLLSFLAGFFRPGITTVKGAPDPLSGTEQAGAMVPNGGLLQQLSAFANNASPAFGNINLTRVPSIVSARTYTGQELVGGWIRREATASFTDCTDTATNIVNAIPGAKVGQTFPFLLANCGLGTATLAAGTGVTLTGSAAVGGFQARLFLGQVTGSAAVTLTNFFAFGGAGGGLANAL